MSTRFNIVGTAIDPDRACKHENFDSFVAIGRFTKDEESNEIISFMADLKIECRDCKEPFRFKGCEAGLSPARPMVSVNEEEIHLPIRPASSDPDFGLGIPGFAIRFRG